MLVGKYKSSAKIEISCVLNNKSLADLRGRRGRVPPSRGPNSLIFMQFLATKLQNNPTLGVGAPLRRILDPPL